METGSRKNKKEQGFTLVETMISIAIFAMISLALFSMFSSILQSVRRNKAILAVNSIMAEQMEVIRGMDYGDVTTVGGFIDGNMPDSEDVTRSGMEFTILRDVSMVDDPYDGTATSDPADLFIWDYKQVRITVEWRDPVTGSAQESVGVTNVVPEGLEGLEEGKGGIYITVFDADGEGIPQALVDISSEDASYSVTGAKTDNNGNLWISDLTPSDDYRVVTTKEDYSTERTYAVNDDDTTPACDQTSPDCNPYNPNPVKRDLRVVDQQVTRAGFAIDLLGSLSISTVRLSSMANWNVNVTKRGVQSDPSAVLVAGADATHPDLIAAFTDTRDVNMSFETEQHIYLQKLAYNTTTGKYAAAWTNDVRAANWYDSQNAIIKKSPTDGSVWMTWDDQSAGIGDSNVYLEKINPSTGAIIGSRYLVNHSAAGTRQTNASMEFDQDGNIYIVWEDNRNGTWDIYLQKFLTGTSAFFQATDVQVNSVSTNEQLGPRVVTDRDVAGTSNANNVYVVWQSNQDSGSGFDIYIRKFNNNVVAGTESKVNTDGGELGQYEPDVAYDGSTYLYVAWTDERNSEPDIYLQKLTKNCAPVFATGDVLINDDTYPSASRTKPSVAYFSDSVIYVTWEDSRNGMPYYTTYTSKINSSAVRQWPYDFMASDIYQSIQTDPFTLADPEGYAITLWGDSRAEAGDMDMTMWGFIDFPSTDEIFGSRYANMDNTALANIPVTVTGQKYIGTTMDGEGLPKYEETFWSDGAGHIDVAGSGGLEWGDYVFSIPAGYGYYLESTNPPFPLTIYPDQPSSILIDVKQ